MSARSTISKKKVARRSTIASSTGSDRPSMKGTSSGRADRSLTVEQAATRWISRLMPKVKILTECYCAEVKNKMPHKICRVTPGLMVSDLLRKHPKRWRSNAKSRHTARIRLLPWYLDRPETLKRKGHIGSTSRSAPTKITLKTWAKRLLVRLSETVTPTVIRQSMPHRSKARPTTGSVKKPQLQEACSNFEIKRLELNSK